jgi:hypothetical protein
MAESWKRYVVSEPVSPLDPRLLDALRAERPAPPDARTRVRDRLESAIPAMRSRPPGGDPGGGASGAAGRGAGALGTSTVGLAAFVLGGITGAALFAALVRSPSPRVVYVDRPAPEMLARASAPPLATAPPSPIAPPVTPSPAAARSSVASSGSALVAAAGPASGPHVSRLTEERVLLDEARQALIQGEPERALGRLHLHRTRFSDGLLVEERDAMQVEALVHAGRYEEARRRAGDFRSRFPGSLFLPTVESAIASIP